MNISIIAAGATITLLLIFGWYSYKGEVIKPIPNIADFPFYQPVSRQRSLGSKTGDSSMWTEAARRTAIAKAYRPDYCCGPKIIRETQYTTGSTSGVVEAYMLSAFGRICPEVCEEDIYDGGGDKCILDGDGTEILDGN